MEEYMRKLKFLLKKNGATILKVAFMIFMIGFIIIGGARELKSIDFVNWLRFN